MQRVPRDGLRARRTCWPWPKPTPFPGPCVPWPCTQRSTPDGWSPQWPAAFVSYHPTPLELSLISRKLAARQPQDGNPARSCPSQTVRTSDLLGPNVPAHHLPLLAELIHSNQFITEPFISLNDPRGPRERPKHGSMPRPQPKPSSYGRASVAGVSACVGAVQRGGGESNSTARPRVVSCRSVCSFGPGAMTKMGNKA